MKIYNHNTHIFLKIAEISGNFVTIFNFQQKLPSVFYVIFFVIQFVEFVNGIFKRGNNINTMAGCETNFTAKPRFSFGIPYSGGFKQEMDATEAAMLLGCRETSSKDVIGRRFRILMKHNHPDKGGNPYIASKINEAYSILSRFAD